MSSVSTFAHVISYLTTVCDEQAGRSIHPTCHVLYRGEDRLDRHVTFQGSPATVDREQSTGRLSTLRRSHIFPPRFPPTFGRSSAGPYRIVSHISSASLLHPKSRSNNCEQSSQRHLCILSYGPKLIHVLVIVSDLSHPISRSSSRQRVATSSIPRCGPKLRRQASPQPRVRQSMRIAYHPTLNAPLRVVAPYRILEHSIFVVTYPLTRELLDR